MEKVLVEHSPDKARLDELGVFDWPVWEKEVSRFDWVYDSAETCYLLEGRVVVEPEGDEAVEFGAGDLVLFPKGLKCVWDIKEAVKKHYNFS
ncbi:MAG: cupin domain-containing protein [Candidatus Omnitrophica bacterium]|nr:cupin domain-containing protein [Candidatus Omnitrophota bacterium]